jgi:uncharacterized protein YdhG (YjbR/CyaY superfamily)
VVATAVLAAATVAPGAADATLTSAMLGYFNSDRGANGLPAVGVINPAMQPGCANHDHYMALIHGLEHGEDPSKPGYVDCGPMSAAEVDEYLRGVDEPKRGTLQALRRTILEIVPDAEQVISYRVPAFRVGGKTVAGFAALKDHLSYLPFSGSVLGQLADQLKGYTMTKSSLHFPLDRPLPKSIVRNLIAVRLAELREAAK